MADGRFNIRDYPASPGIYIFKNSQGKVLYVGKANNIRSRLSSYFQPITSIQKERPWIAVMVQEASLIETTVVNNEMEALMLESTLIKQHEPRFNIKLTDDKAFPYIKLVTSEPIPRFAVTRRQTKDGATYFGPYLSARNATYTLEYLRKLYGIHISPKPLRFNDRACMPCQLSGFSCPISGEVEPAIYAERVEKATQFLRGKRRSLVDDVERRMEQASVAHQFELAAKLRDQLTAMRQVLSNQSVVSTTIDDYDVINVASAMTSAVVSVMAVREGRLVSQKAFAYESGGEEIEELLGRFLMDVYQYQAELPKLLITANFAQKEKFESYLRNIAGHVFEIRSAERGEKKTILDLALKNAQTKLETLLVRADQGISSLVALKELLKLDKLPERIEAIDISNLGTSEPVGACICFINGESDKNEYRRYKIKTVAGQNDFAMIGEVVRRRLADTARPTPDLLMIDGGLVQLDFAIKAAEKALVQPGLILSLAKKPDRIFLPGKKRPLPASKGNKGLLLLSRIRDEVHRFGITFQRSRQRKKSLRTEG